MSVRYHDFFLPIPFAGKFPNWRFFPPTAREKTALGHNNYRGSLSLVKSMFEENSSYHAFLFLIFSNFFIFRRVVLLFDNIILFNLGCAKGKPSSCCYFKSKEIIKKIYIRNRYKIHKLKQIIEIEIFY